MDFSLYQPRFLWEVCPYLVSLDSAPRIELLQTEDKDQDLLHLHYGLVVFIPFSF